MKVTRRILWILIWLLPCLNLLPASKDRLWTLFRHPSPFASLSTGDGLSQGSVLAICQDQRGFMWFGTEDGLNRYDGYRFNIYKPDPARTDSISDNFIQAIFEDAAGNLWIGTGSGGLNQYDRVNDCFIHYKFSEPDPFSLSSNAVTCIFQDRAGVIWIGTDGGGLNRMAYPKRDGKRAGFIHFLAIPQRPETLSSDFVTAIFQDREGDIWVGTKSGLNRMFPLDKGSLSVRFLRIAIPSQAKGQPAGGTEVVTSINEDEFGRLWIGTQDGLFRFDRRSNHWTSFRRNPRDEKSLSHNYVRVVFRDRMKNLWIGTDGGGLNRMTLKGPEDIHPSFLRYQFNPDNPAGLKSNAVESLYEDSAGVLWVGLYFSGINKIVLSGGNREERELEKIVHYQNMPNDPASLSNNFVNAISESRSGAVWIGTDGGGLNKVLPSGDPGMPLRFVFYRHNPADKRSLSDDVVTALHLDRKGNLWIGTYTGGLNRLVREGEGKAPSVFTHFRHDPDNPQNLSSDFIVSIYEDRQGIMWIGTIDGGLNRLDTGREIFTHFKNDPNNFQSSIDNNINAILEDRHGNLWLGTVEGLERMDREKEIFTHYVHDPANPRSLSANYVQVIFEDSQGRLWIGTNGGGLNQLRPGDAPSRAEFICYQEKDGLTSDVVLGILEDEDGKLWLSTGKGLCCFDPGSATFKSYSAAIEMQKEEFNRNAFCKSRSGELFFGGKKGLYIFHPGDLYQNRHVPQVALTDFQLFNKPVPIGKMPDGRVIIKSSITEADEIELSHRDNVLSLEFAALDFIMPDRNQYAYKLDGLDADWNYSGNRRFVTYMRLPIGVYTFQVKASNNDGVWNQKGVSLKIIVRPPFWKTPWFLFLSILFLVFAAHLLFRLRIRQLKRQQRVLEKVVEMRTEELKEMSLKDPLTELWNRRFMDEVLIYDLLAFIADRRYLQQNPEERRRGSEDGIFGIVLIDIDHFKKVNDDYGHTVGDHLLVMFSEILKKSVRADDVVIRFGGEEFLVVLKKCSLTFLDAFTRRIKEKVGSQEFEIAGQTIRKTCSLGYTHFPFYERMPDLIDFDKVLMIADWGLYYAKHHGRNMAVKVMPSGRIPDPGQLQDFGLLLEFGETNNFFTIRAFR